ncbi:hypothetical protein JTB14_008002 [Gonioctena quinquepunctata]|nr:hypothetical protein JTB14_008002 [Gonioctena quinquepunctata]
MLREFKPVMGENTHVGKGNSETCSDLLDSESINNKGPIFGKRHIQVVMCGFLFFLMACNNSSMSITILAMTNSTASDNPDIPVSRSVIHCSLYLRM